MTSRIASQAILRHARGQRCTLRFAECNTNPETTVSAHIRDAHKGMAQKASDYSVVFACSACHQYLDECIGTWGTSAELRAQLYWHIIRGLQETWAILIEDGIIMVPQDRQTPTRDKPTRPRKPKTERQKIHSRPFEKRQPT